MPRLKIPKCLVDDKNFSRIDGKLIRREGGTQIFEPFISPHMSKLVVPVN